MVIECVLNIATGYCDGRMVNSTRFCLVSVVEKMRLIVVDVVIGNLGGELGEVFSLLGKPIGQWDVVVGRGAECLEREGLQGSEAV